MKTTLKSRLVQNMVDFFHDEGGAEGLEKLLIVGAVALPLLGVLILLRNKISEWMGTTWNNTAGDTALTPPTLDTPQ